MHISFPPRDASFCTLVHRQGDYIFWFACVLAQLLFVFLFTFRKCTDLLVPSIKFNTEDIYGVSTMQSQAYLSDAFLWNPLSVSSLI